MHAGETMHCKPCYKCQHSMTIYQSLRCRVHNSFARFSNKCPFIYSCHFQFVSQLYLQAPRFIGTDTSIRENIRETVYCFRCELFCQLSENFTVYLRFNFSSLFVMNWRYHMRLQCLNKKSQFVSKSTLKDILEKQSNIWAIRLLMRMPVCPGNNQLFEMINIGWFHIDKIFWLCNLIML